MQEFLDFLKFLDEQLVSRELPPLEALLMQASFSSLVGEFAGTDIPKYCHTTARNRYHNGYPDLLPKDVFTGNAVQHGHGGIEIKASRYSSGWQGHNAEVGWLMVYTFEASRPEMTTGGAEVVPFRYTGVYAAELTADDWTFSGRSETSRRTITASVNKTGMAKMLSNWIYRD